MYVYAIVSRPVRARSLSSGAGPRLRPVIGGGAAAIVAECAERPSPTMDAIRKHDAVVRRIARAVPAILPVRFGTIVDTDHSLAALLEAWSAELQPAFGLVERREESLDVGLERLKHAALDPSGSIDDLLTRVLAQAIPSGSADDTAILGLRWQS